MYLVISIVIRFSSNFSDLVKCKEKGNRSKEKKER